MTDHNDKADRGLASAQHYTDATGWTPGNLDHFTVKQADYSADDHAVWKTLYKRQLEVLPGRAIEQFMDNLSTLGIDQDRIPDFDDINAILKKRTGWQVVAVPGLIPDEPFFELLANKRFPVGNFIRTADQLDYIQEPDVFHDVFGHVPLLADETFGNYIVEYGKGGLKAAKLGTINKLARLYWYTVEFGLIREKDDIRIYGAGILSSPTESVFALESDSPHRIGFDLKRILQTEFQIDDFQDNYFVIDSFDQLFKDTLADFTPIYKELEKAPTYDSGTLLPTDTVLHIGTGTYAVEANKRRAARR